MAVFSHVFLWNTATLTEGDITALMEIIMVSKGTIRQPKEKQIKWRILECEASAGNEAIRLKFKT
ncbi:uncharacterized protein N7496_002193 [Penicillium cataractarum]|uniref:Uncharacterized protein n=1 Tax=Penicillium cataractarum TaxID=2100454 RepID=A0A9W9VHL3_9EURO|nr:uncharacterized protein N7496_002193 [Penicillium cataractarum]KAJ5379765.1 hypothetical protein N7496_002193 [Penicillium cataractarum]